MSSKLAEVWNPLGEANRERLIQISWETGSSCITVLQLPHSWIPPTAVAAQTRLSRQQRAAEAVPGRSCNQSKLLTDLGYSMQSNRAPAHPAELRRHLLTPHDLSETTPCNHSKHHQPRGDTGLFHLQSSAPLLMFPLEEKATFRQELSPELPWVTSAIATTSQPRASSGSATSYL